MISMTPVQIFDNVEEDRGRGRLMCAASADRNRQCAPHGSVAPLRRTLYAHDGQIRTACLKLDIEFDPHARLAFDQGPRPRTVIQEWKATHDIPVRGGENARINLWLYRGRGPTDDHEVEVIVKRFAFVPEL